MIMIKFLFIFYLSFLLAFDAQAYIDPGSGSIIIQAIIEKIENFGKTFDQLTKETVKAFLSDSKKSNFKI